MASALLLIQQNESMNSKVPKIRETYSKMISDKLEDSVAKFGAILAQGVIDAGVSVCVRVYVSTYMYMYVYEYMYVCVCVCL